MALLITLYLIRLTMSYFLLRRIWIKEKEFDLTLSMLCIVPVIGLMISILMIQMTIDIDSREYLINKIFMVKRNKK